MDASTIPDPAVVLIRCSNCRRSLGRWAVDPLGPAIVPAPRQRPRGRVLRHEPAGPGRWEEVRSVPVNRPAFDAYSTERGVELVCRCRRGYERRRVSISAAGLLRLLTRLGSPEEVEL